MKTIRIIIHADVDDHASDDDIVDMVTAAYVQVSEPANEEGDRADFTTEHVTVSWTEVDRQYAVVDAMRLTGLDVSWDYPGMAVITYHTHDGTERQVSTGLNGWEYGTVTEGGEPTDEPAEPAALADPNVPTNDPFTIALAWYGWVQAQREG